MFRNETLEPLLRHLTTRGNPPKWFVMIAAYIDESGAHAGAPALSVAVTAADYEGWAGFGKNWLAKTAHLGEGGYHAKKHGALHGELARLMVDHTLFSSYVTIKEDEFHSQCPKWVQSVFGGPYAFGVLLGMSTYAAWAAETGSEAAYYFVEQGHRGFPHVSSIMRAISVTPDLRQMFAFAGWAPADKSDIPVHCPDTISHLASEHYGRENSPFIQTLYDEGKIWRGNFSADLLKEAMPRFKAAARQTLRENRAERESHRAARKARNSQIP